jgi:hypothetical protein
MPHTFVAKTQMFGFSWPMKTSGYNLPLTMLKWLGSVPKNVSGLRVSALLLL